MEANLEKSTWCALSQHRDVVNESRVPTWRLGDRVKIMTEVI